MRSKIRAFFKKKKLSVEHKLHIQLNAAPFLLLQTGKKNKITFTYLNIYIFTYLHKAKA